MTARLLLDEHYSDAIAVALRDRHHDVVSVVADSDLRGSADADVFLAAAASGRRIVTENIKDFRPLLMAAAATGAPAASLLLIPPRRFPRGRGDRSAVIVTALHAWLSAPDVDRRPVENWLT